MFGLAGGVHGDRVSGAGVAEEVFGVGQGVGVCAEEESGVGGVVLEAELVVGHGEVFGIGGRGVRFAGVEVAGAPGCGCQCEDIVRDVGRKRTSMGR